jgi:hypothetical protein
MRAIAAVLAVLIAAPAAAGENYRDPAQVRAFRKAKPCPATGKPNGPCGGWVVDHIRPLCVGGADHPSNMQWQTVSDAKKKDVDEIRECRALKRVP